MDVIWQRLRLRFFTLQYHHLPTSISKISSKDIIFVNKMNNKYIYDSKNSIAWRRRRGSGSCLRDGVPRSRSCLRAAAQLWILASRRRALLWILAAGGGAALDPISLSRIHEDLHLERHKHMPHSSECTWHMFHALRG